MANGSWLMVDVARVKARGLRPWIAAFIAALVLTFSYCLLFTSHCSLLTPDQRGDRLMRRGEFIEAAEQYQDPMRIGAAWYRAGEFKEAANAFGRARTPEARFNLANALVMQGVYEGAVEVYDSALAGRPGWPEAQGNREIARLRAERSKTEGGEMTGGMLEADEIVFSSGKKDGGAEQTTDEGEPLSDQALQELWLRRIQTRPADFLKAKFAYQHARETVNSDQ